MLSLRKLLFKSVRMQFSLENAEGLGMVKKRNKTRQKFSHSNGNSADVASMNVCCCDERRENYMGKCFGRNLK